MGAIMKIIFALITLFFTFSCLASASDRLDCKNPKNTNKCAEREMLKAESDLRNFSLTLKDKLSRYVDVRYSDDFDNIQQKWMSLVSEQCEHSRALYGRGTFGPLSVITCREFLYKNRIKELKIIYEDAFSER